MPRNLDMQVLALMAGLSLAFASNLYADVPDRSIAECSGLKPDIERLACFDRLSEAKGLAPSTVLTPVDGKGKWVTATSKNPLTDKSNYIALIESDTKMRGSEDNVAMAVKCADKKTSLFISWGIFLGTEEIDIDHRVGRGKASKSAWNISTDHKSSFYQGSTVKLLKEISGSDSFIARVVPYGENAVTVTFDVRGAAQALTDIRANCGW